MTKFYSRFVDFDAGFRKEEDVKKAITSSKNYQDGESALDARALNFFSTTKQRSYLVATGRRVYCIVDDSRKSNPTVNWSVEKAAFKRAALEFESKTDKTGLVDFGTNHRNWLYSKSIFSTPDTLRAEVSKLLSDEG